MNLRLQRSVKKTIAAERSAVDSSQDSVVLVPSFRFLLYLRHAVTPHTTSRDSIWSFGTCVIVPHARVYRFWCLSSFPVDHISPVTAMTSLEHVADTAAAGQVVRDYLAARGIRTTATLALMAKTESELEKHLMLPLFNGWKTESGCVLRIPPEEQPIVQAILLHMWSICRKQWADSMTPTPSLTATVPTSPGTASAKTSTSDDKVPKTLPPGTWSSLIRKYQEEQLHGVNRVFPQRELLGAESTLARMHHELHISRMFTPVQLGEIIEKRSFTASGDVNPLSKARKTQQLTVEDAQLVYHDEPTSWTPRSLLATLDGLTSIRWAMVLIEWGPEAEVERLFTWLTQRARSRPQKMEQFNSYFTAISWQLCMDLRGGISFAETAKRHHKGYGQIHRIYVQRLTSEGST